MSRACLRRLQAAVSSRFWVLPIGMLLFAGCVLSAYVIRGAPSAHSLINAESAGALSFVIAVCSWPRTSMPNETRGMGDRYRPVGLGFLVLPALSIIVAIGYHKILTAPFVFDDYGHIAEASRSSWRATLSLFGPAEHKPGLFFRPIGFLLYRLNYLFAGDHVMRWHAGSISLHAIDSWLVYLLCRKLGIGRSGSACAGLLFAINGCAAEPVAWVDAGFDLIATGFVLLALIFMCQYLDSGTPGYIVAALGVTSVAVLCKESAFCLPALVVCVALLRPKGAGGPRARSGILWVAAVCAALFGYRWWALGGIGGYGVRGAGVADFLQHNFIPRMNALLVRQWAILFFPVNWSTPVSPALRIALAALPVLLVMLAVLGRPVRRQFLACLGFTLAASIPAQKMLLIGLDLSGTRTLYLPNVGMAIAWGLLLGALEWRLQAAFVCGLLAVQTLTLEHNLIPWRSVPESARSACVTFGRQMTPGTGPVIVRGLPATRSGVVFLANGFPECVQMNTGVSGDRIHVQNSSQEYQPDAFDWDERRGFVREALK